MHYGIIPIIYGMESIRQVKVKAEVEKKAKAKEKVK